MPIEILRGPADAPIEPLLERRVAVIGYGNQGHAHALNLRDSGIEVAVANRADTANGQRAAAAGFEPLPIKEAVRAADLIIIALPDETHHELYPSEVEPYVPPGAVIGFLHGYALRYGFVRPREDLGVVLVAPKGPGRTLRARFERGQGIPALFALEQSSNRLDARAIGLAWAAGLGCARSGIILTTVADEAETDLFGEQSVLCGGLTSLILTAFEELVAAGYPKELAYLECCHEVKQVADLIYARGLAGMMTQISNTAEFGAHHAGPTIVDGSVRARIRQVLRDVQDGTFAEALQSDHRDGAPELERSRRRLAEHAIESAGVTVRALMPWLEEEAAG